MTLSMGVMGVVNVSGRIGLDLTWLDLGLTWAKVAWLNILILYSKFLAPIIF